MGFFLSLKQKQYIRSRFLNLCSIEILGQIIFYCEKLSYVCIVGCLAASLAYSSSKWTTLSEMQAHLTKGPNEGIMGLDNVSLNHSHGL